MEENQNNNSDRNPPVEVVTVGSVTIPIYYAPVTIIVAKGEIERRPKTYPSYIISYHEGVMRRQRRRKTLEKAREHAKEVAKRLNKEMIRRFAQPLKAEYD